MKIPSLQAINETVRQVMVDNLAAQSGGSSKQLYNALEMVNQSAMWQQVQWMHEIILPKVLQNRGVDSIEYKNYVGIRNSLIWSMLILQQYERVLMQIGQERQKLDYYIKQNAWFEQELTKYRTVEQLFGTEALQHIKDGIINRALDLLDSKPKTNNNENAK